MAASVRSSYLKFFFNEIVLKVSANRWFKVAAFVWDMENLFFSFALSAEAYLELNGTSTMEFFVKVINN